MRTLLSLLALAVAGCASRSREAEIERQRRAEGDAAKARYWELQAAQRVPAAKQNTP